MATATSMRPSRIRRARAAEMFRAVLLRLPVHARGALVVHLHAIDAHVALARLRIARDHQRPGDESPGILRPALQDRKFQKRETFAADHFLARTRLHRLRKKRAQFRQLGQHLDLVQQTLRRLHVQEPANALGHFLERIDFQRQMNAPLAAQRIDEQRNSRAFGVLEKQRRAAGARHALRDLGDLQHRIDFRRDALQFPRSFPGAHELPQILIGHDALRLSSVEINSRTA